MARYVANAKISGPMILTTKPDKDLGGLCWSYKVGLMYPAAAAVPAPVLLPPSLPSDNPIGKGRTR